MKINNNPKKDAPLNFIFSWDSIKKNEDLRDTKLHKSISCNFTTKFILETCKCCEGDDEDYGFSTFMIIILFVKDYNAYYKAQYTRCYTGDFYKDGNDSEVLENELEFTLLDKGIHKFMIKNSYNELLKYIKD